jgi:hypothetical protein
MSTPFHPHERLGLHLGGLQLLPHHPRAMEKCWGRLLSGTEVPCPASTLLLLLFAPGAVGSNPWFSRLKCLSIALGPSLTQGALSQSDIGVALVMSATFDIVANSSKHISIAWCGILESIKYGAHDGNGTGHMLGRFIFTAP